MANRSARSIHRSDYPSIDDLAPIEAFDRRLDDGSDLSLDFSRNSQDDYDNEHADSLDFVNINRKIKRKES